MTDVVYQHAVYGHMRNCGYGAILEDFRCWTRIVQAVAAGWRAGHRAELTALRLMTMAELECRQFL